MASEIITILDVPLIIKFIWEDGEKTGEVAVSKFFFF